MNNKKELQPKIIKKNIKTNIANTSPNVCVCVCIYYNYNDLYEFL